MTVRRTLRRLLWRFGYDLRYLPSLKFSSIGLDQFEDAKHHTRADRPVIFDVGANVGQSITRARKHWPSSVIHAFEPSEATFAILKKNTFGMPNLHLNQCALGANGGQATFLLYADSVHSSILAPGAGLAPSAVIGEQSVTVRTVDEYCAEHHIDRVDLLKIDTQGYDLEVLRGAERTLRSAPVVFVELTFSDTYAGQPPYYEVLRFLHETGFALGGIYDITYGAGRADWADAMLYRTA